MSNLTYKNHSTDVILQKYVNILSANGTNTYMSSNIIEMSYKLVVDVEHASQCADVFARQIYTLRGKCDFKRFLGANDRKWLYLLHCSYIYSYLKCVYYGMCYNEIVSLPEDNIAFPGHVLLLHMLRRQRFQFNSTGSFTSSLYGKIESDYTLKDFLEPFFSTYPELGEGISQINNIYTYSNSRFEAILKGLYDALTYLNSKRDNSDKNLFQMNKINDSQIVQFLSPESNPLFNGHLNKTGDKYFFILPKDGVVNDNLHFNESMFLTRAVDLRSSQLVTSQNPYYIFANRIQIDFMIREDVYAVTGLESNMMPYGENQVMDYCNVSTDELIGEEIRRNKVVKVVLTGPGTNGRSEDPRTP
jgi:hypothetical protein